MTVRRVAGGARASREIVEGRPDTAPACCGAALRGLALEGLQLGEDHLDGIDAGRSCREMPKAFPGTLDRGMDLGAAVGAERTRDDDVARPAPGSAALSRMGPEADAVDRSIEEAGRREACRECAFGTLAIRHPALPASASTSSPSHVGVPQGPADEGEARGGKARLARTSRATGSSEVRTIRPCGVDRF
jgi:hypothetical protein